MAIATPYYLIDERKLLHNLRIIKHVRDVSGAKSLLALKCFSTWCVFDLMRKFMDGTTGSSLYEVRLGHEKFGEETHAYCVAYSRDELRDIKKYADVVIFNSITQLKRFHSDVRTHALGVRINPGFSYSHYDLADPARRNSRLGVTGKNAIREVMPLINGCHVPFQLRKRRFPELCRESRPYRPHLGRCAEKLEWVSLGGGLSFTKKNYPVDAFCALLKDFGARFGVQVYLEPGEAAITQSTELVTTVLDIVRNATDIAIVDASIEAHMLDHLIYRTSPAVSAPRKGRYRCTVAGRSCLAGDVFGRYRFASRLKVGTTVRIADAGGYTMVKKNWFNGLQMPAIAVKRLNGSIELVRKFDYNNFINNLS